MTEPCFELSFEGAVAHLVMSRGEQLNTMTKAFWRDLPDIVRKLDREAKARVIVLSAQGRVFTAGMDLENFSLEGSPFPEDGKKADKARVAEAALHQVRQLQDSLSSLEQIRLPVIAAIQGACVGGGVDLVTACDLRYCTENAWFCIQETPLGIVADVGTLQRLPKLIPNGIARELAFTGDRLPAKRALELGLVSGVFADQAALMEHVSKVAQRIAGHSPLTTAGIKSVMNYSRDHGVAAGLEHVALWNTAMISGRDLSEGVQAQVEKRPTQYDSLPPIKDYWNQQEAS